MSTQKTYKLYKPETGMHGPYGLDDDTINDLDEDIYGVYVLVAKGDKGGTIVVYVGRGIVKDRMREHVEEKDASAFYFKPLDDDDTGFAEECRLFHLYGKRPHLDNRQHPDVPDGAPRTYPRCSQRGCSGEPD